MGCFNWILILFLPNFALASLKNAKIHPDLPLVELKQHRHNMDQLEPDLAQTIFDGVQKNPLERTTTVKPLKNIRSPTLRGKREAEIFIKMANIKIVDDGFNDSNSSAIESIDKIGENSNQTFVIDERLNLEIGSNETIVDQEKHEILASEAVIGTTSILEKDEIFKILEAENQTSADSIQEISISEVTNSTESVPKIVEVSTEATQKSEFINFTQNDNLPTANLDRKILAFEVDFHNKKIIAEILQKKQLFKANSDPAHFSDDLGLSNAETNEKKTQIWETVPSEAVLHSNSAEILPVLPRKKILDSTIQKKRRIISNFVTFGAENQKHKVLKRTKRELTKKLLQEILAAKVLEDNPIENQSEKKSIPSQFDISSLKTTTKIVPITHVIVNEITKPPTTTTEATTTISTTLPSTTTTTAKPTTKSFPTSRVEKLKLLEKTGPRNGIVLGLVKVTSTPTNEVDFSVESVEDDGNPWKNKYKSHIQIHLTDESREVVERSDLKILPKLISVENSKKLEDKSFEFRDLPDTKEDLIIKDSEIVSSAKKPVSENVDKSVNLPKTTTVPIVPSMPQIPQVFQPQKQVFVPFQQTMPPVTLNQFVVDGRRFIVPSIPENSAVFWTPPPFQPQFFQPQTSIAAPILRTAAPVISTTTASTRFASIRKIVHAGRVRSNASPSDLNPVRRGERLKEEEINFVRIFEQDGTTKHVFAPLTTTLPTTTESTTLSTITTTVEATTTVPTTTKTFFFTTTSEKSTMTIQATKFSTTTTKNIATTTTTPESTTTVRKHDPPPADIPNLEEFVHKQTTKRPNLKLVRLEKFVDFDSWRAKPANDFIGDVPKAKPDLQGFGNRFLAIHG